MTYQIINGTYYAETTPPELAKLLDDLRLSKTRIKITYGDRKTGKVWNGKPERGTICRSWGPIKIPLLLKTKRSTEGEGLLEHCIVKVERTDGHVLWQSHPNSAD